MARTRGSTHPAGESLRYTTDTTDRRLQILIRAVSRGIDFAFGWIGAAELCSIPEGSVLSLPDMLGVANWAS